MTLRVCLWGCLMPPAVQAGAEPSATFDPTPHEVVLGTAERITVLTGFLTGRPVADLAAVSVDAAGARRLRLFSHEDGAWSPSVEAGLRRETAFVDVAAISGRERLIVWGGGRLTWLDVAAGVERDLLEVESDYPPAAAGGPVPHVDVTHDLNGDHLDDLAVPDGSRFHVFVQLSNGSFAAPLLIGPSTGRGPVLPADGYRYRPWDEFGRVHEFDHDLDGRPDLAYWNGDAFVVHLQDERGLIAAMPRTFTTDVRFDSDEIVSLSAPVGIRHRRHDHMPEGESSGRVLYALADVDGDGVGDLVVFALDGSSLWRMRSSCEIHFGSRGADGAVEFSPEVGAVVRSQGILAGLDHRDLDGDGQVDFMLTAFEPSVFSAIRVLVRSVLTGAGSFDVAFHRMQDGAFGARPAAVREIRPRSANRTGESTAWPAVLVGDLNGDGRSDLVIQRNLKALHVHPGVAGPGLFADQAQRVRVEDLPRAGEYLWLADLDRNGKDDVVIHQPSTEAPHRLTVLMSR